MERTLGQPIRIDEQGRALIPKRLREVLGIRGGDAVVARIEAGCLVLEPRATLLKRLQERYASASDHVDGLLELRRDEVGRAGG